MRRRGHSDDPAPLGPVLEHYGIEVTPRLGWSKIVCPFHDEDEPSCVVDVDGGGFSCFACGVKGRGPAAFIMAKDGVEYDVARVLRDELYGTTTKRSNAPRRVERGGFRPSYRRRSSLT